jgi:hypothetical protein
MASIKKPMVDLINALKGIEAIRWAAVWNNQIKRVEEGKADPFNMPAAFVEIQAPEQMGDIGLGIVAGDLVIKIHLADNMLDAGDGTMDQNLEIFDIKDSIVKALSGKPLTACSALQRTGESQNNDHNNVYEYILEFKTHFIDSKGSDYDEKSDKFIYTTPPSDLQVTTQNVPSINNIENVPNRDINITT